ncbi:MAG: class I SAM-dependent methyltransferase [Myxococcota bacterium]
MPLSLARRAIRVPHLGPFLVGIYRAWIALGVAARAIRAAGLWWWRSREITNFTYDLMPLNREHLVASLSVVTGEPHARIRGWIAELEEDRELLDALRLAAARGPDSAISDTTPRFGRRLAWYVLVRWRKPRKVVETGVDRGLGAATLTAALARNHAEGHPGEYIGIDPNPAAGGLLIPDLARFGRVLRGSSLDHLTEIDAIDLFIHDSDHSEAHERAEFELVESRLSEGAIVVTDNAHVTGALLQFAERTKRRYLCFSEQPRFHWHRGAGTGIAFD